MNRCTYTKHRMQHGFTLVETLVAITILLLVVIGPMTIAQQGIQNAFYSNEQTTAVFLAQEGIELMRKERDDKALEIMDDGDAGQTRDWYSDLIAECKNNTGCDINVSTGAYRSCSANGCILKEDPAGTTVVYGYAAGTPSKYTRVIKVGAEVAAGGGWPVTATVSWNSNVLGSRSVVLQSWIYDQYKQ